MRRSLLIAAAMVCIVPSLVRAQCADALDPLNDGTTFNPFPNLVISEINPGDYIELFNTTMSDIAMNASPYWLCSPFVYVSLPLAGGTVVVPAGGYATIPWPVSFTDTNAGGEIQLYSTNLFDQNRYILDFVCWGVNPHPSRLNQALTVGKWSGACAGALVNGAIHRNIGTMGKTAADYDVTADPSPQNCTPVVTGVGGTPKIPDVRVLAFPNPFHASTMIEVSLDQEATIEVSIYSVTGALVRTLPARSLATGPNRLPWDGTDAAGNPVASGTYLVRASHPAGLVAATRVTLVR